MYSKKIKLETADKVKDFVNEVGTYEFDVDIQYNRFAIDAKSLLGVLSLDLSKELTVKYGEENIEFENLLNKYRAS